VRALKLVLVITALCACAGCSSSSQSQPGTSSSSSPGSALSTTVVSVRATSQLSEMVRWNATNGTTSPQLATCEVLVLNGKTQLGDYGPVQVVVAAGATAEEYSEVTTLAGNSAGDQAQIVCQKGLTPANG
jgi:hypothetical protein